MKFSWDLADVADEEQSRFLAKETFFLVSLDEKREPFFFQN